ncbi:protein CutA homolog isoform X2 [Procambarus clarkii]|uniref:protein CutA homolog isoform X2 n=1 Tax=Procambarus clarkii TaxID=6728 RepID=UPI001E67879A|nr:protein CutA homolog isoform X2 [Procambarus clarkii]XP_045619245.1 protein CutA homolog isoform X2 [Procambarus clarkii]XP_045619246.1 protein CutA homolog isoform X2 [Procambarus clarkii]XP_045619248.1 protein CutA homolog isoform X2 [Procambarus clarkii]
MMSRNITLFCMGLAFIAVFMPILLTTGRHLLSSMAATVSYVAGTHSMAFVTAPSQEVAKKIASGLVKNKLAACVNIIPNVVSVYEWKEEINEDSEVLMMIKTRTSRLEELTKFVRENHPYDVCEVISSQIDQGNQPYLDWISSIVPDKTPPV